MMAMAYEIPQAVEGCPGCNSSGGIYSCPTHSPGLSVRRELMPFTYLSVRCPWCGKDIVFEGYKEAVINSKILGLPAFLVGE